MRPPFITQRPLALMVAVALCTRSPWNARTQEDGRCVADGEALRPSLARAAPVDGHRVLAFVSGTEATHGGSVRWQSRIGASAHDSREQSFREYGAHDVGLSVGAGTRSGVQMELGSTVNTQLGTHRQLRSDIALLGSAMSNASTRLARLHGAGTQAFELPGAVPRVMDYRPMLGADYKRSRLSLSTALGADISIEFNPLSLVHAY